MAENDQNKSEKKSCCSAEKCCPSKCVNWCRAFKAGIVATAVMTIVMFLLGINSLEFLGQLVLGSGATTLGIYTTGTIIHFGVGVFYAFIFALFIAPIPFMNGAVKGILYGTVLMIISWFAMPPLVNAVMDARDPYKPGDPCTVMVMEETITVTTVNVCQPNNPCSAKQAMANNPCNPCNPANPCGGNASAVKFMEILISWVNHAIYGLVLGLMYCRKKGKKEEF